MKLFEIATRMEDVVDDKMVSSALSILKPVLCAMGSLDCYTHGVYGPGHNCHEAPHRSHHWILLFQPQQFLQGSCKDLYDTPQSTGDVSGQLPW